MTAMLTDETLTDWTLAACQAHDPELFFPVGTEGPAVEQLRAAKAVCGGCPVRTACLRWALDTGQDAGVWGGTSEEDRRDMRRARLARVPAPRTGD